MPRVTFVTFHDQTAKFQEVTSFVHFDETVIRKINKETNYHPTTTI